MVEGKSAFAQIQSKDIGCSSRCDSACISGCNSTGLCGLVPFMRLYALILKIAIISKNLSEVERLRLTVAKLEVENERLKKGYLAKGVGASKEFVTGRGKSSRSLTRSDPDIP